MTHRGVAVHDRDCARSGGEGFRAHDLERIVEGHHFAAMHAPGGMHVIVAGRTPTGDEAIFPQLKQGHVNLVAMIGRYFLFLAAASITASTSSSRMMKYSSRSILISWPEYLAEQDGVTGLDVERDALAVILRLAVADRDHLTLLRLFLAMSGMMMPPTFCSPSSMRWTMMRVV